MENEQGTFARRGLLLLVAALLCATAFSLIFLAREHSRVRDLTARRDETAAALNQLRGQLDVAFARINALSAASRPPAAAVAAEALEAPGAAAVTPRPRAARVRTHEARARAVRRPAEDPRWKRIQTQLSDQEKQIASTREEVARARDDLQGKLSSTRDELSGSIARTHDEVVALQKRGERNYYEFQLTKSKQFQRVGPIGLSLRKTNFKRKSYDVAMLVDDFQLNKKSVNLFEPIWVNLSDRPEPVQVVINQVGKNDVKGYLSEPKHKKSELAATAPSGAPPKAPEVLR